MKKCLKCKNPIDHNAVDCEWCGTTSSSLDNSNSMSQNNKYQINIQMENQWYLVPPKIQVFIDDNMVSKIKGGECLTCSISEGVHSILFKLSFRETAFDITVKQDSTIFLRLSRTTGKIDVTISGNSYFMKRHK